MALANPDALPATNEKLLPEEDLRRLMHGLLSGLSHDLRTPLSTINGWLYVLDSDKLDATARKRALAKMRANIEEQVRLIDDVLLLSRSISGHLVVDAALISPVAPLEAAMENLQTTAVAASVSLAPAKVRDSVNISADAELLRRVFEILIFHGLKTTPAGGAIETAVAVQENHVEIAISDTGKGLSPPQIAALFDAFGIAESESGSAYPGAERNLMLAKMLVEKQGGQLNASSSGPGLGTTFTLRMPCVNAPMSAVNVANASAI